MEVVRRQDQRLRMVAQRCITVAKANHRAHMMAAVDHQLGAEVLVVIRRDSLLLFQDLLQVW